MKAIKQITVRLVMGCVLALGLVSNVHAQIELPPDDPGDTNDPPTAEEIAAQYQAWLAALNTEYTNNFAPWIHGTELSAFGLAQSASFSSWQADGVPALLHMGESFGNMQAEQYAAATNFALANDWPLVMTNEATGGIAVLVNVEGQRPVYIGAYNLNAADTIGVDELWTNGSSGLNLNGEGTQIAMWDEGDPRLTHREFTTNSVRIFDLDGGSSLGTRDHPTHVSGTLGAYGVTGAAKGMANRASILVNDYNGDLGEMPAEFATNQFRLSNHSYGIITIGWYGIFTYQGVNYPFWWGDGAISLTEDYHFGLYDTNSQTLDRIVYASRYYLPVWAAGNERGLSGKPAISQANGHIGFYNNDLAFYPAPKLDDGGTNGYDTLPPHSVAKNCLTIGAVSNIVSGYSGSNSVGMSTFSSFGPTDDGRIKPDVVGDGVNVYSTGSLFDSDYYADSGTSMASPNVCGALNLLVQLHNRYMGTNQPMLSSTLRGLAIHTADETGTTTGPDYKFGWGLLNTLNAARLMTNNFVSGSIPFIKEVKLPNGDYIEFPVVAKGGEPLKVTVCWIDPAGNPQPIALDPTNRVLVNDIDIRVIASNGTTNFPYALNPAAPANAATNADNDRDNVEQSNIVNPVTNGVYLVRLTHKGTLKNDTGAMSDQWVSILVSGNVAQSEPPIAIERIAQTSTNTVGLRWNANVGRIYQVEYRNDIASGTWSPATGEINATKTNVAVSLPMTVNTRFYRLARIR